MDKKGVEMSMQVVVVAVIVLLIMAVLIYMSVKYLRAADEGFGACESKGGRCGSSCQGGEQAYPIGNGDCKDRGGVCCISGDSLFDTLS